MVEKQVVENDGVKKSNNVLTATSCTSSGSELPITLTNKSKYLIALEKGAIKVQFGYSCLQELFLQ